MQFLIYTWIYKKLQKYLRSTSSLRGFMGVSGSVLERFLVTLVKIILAEHKPVFLRMFSLMPITNGQLATSSHIPGKLNRWNNPYSVTINLPENIKGNNCDTRNNTGIRLTLQPWSKLKTCKKLIKNKTKWIKKQSDMKKTLHSIMNLHSLGRIFIPNSCN